MILPIAWRNIWRSRTRSMIVIGAVLIGVWAFIMMTALTFGITRGYVDSAIRFQTSHLQIHHPQFVEDKEIEYTISGLNLKDFENTDGVSFVTQRALVQGMVKSSRGARGVTIKGINPEEEEALSSISEKLVDGDFFAEEKKNQIVISQEIADKLSLRLRKKLVLQFIDAEGEIVAGSFRVAGIFKTGNRILDLSSVFVRQRDLTNLIKMEEAIHEVVIQLEDPNNDLDAVQATLSDRYPNLLVENYRQIAPDVELYESQIYVSITILLVIFMLALIFGIVNTMLMAVLERTKELGMLMAVGMGKVRIFLMIVLETLLLGLIGAPLGLLLGWLTVQLTNRKGIDLTSFAQGAERFGMQTHIRPFMENQLYVQLMVAVFITALLASIYPALRAIKLRPIDAIRKI